MRDVPRIEQNPRHPDVGGKLWTLEKNPVPLSSRELYTAEGEKGECRERLKYPFEDRLVVAAILRSLRSMIIKIVPSPRWNSLMDSRERKVPFLLVDARRSRERAQIRAGCKLIPTSFVARRGARCDRDYVIRARTYDNVRYYA